MDIIASLYSALSADATLVSMLDEFEGAPAIFSGDMLPPGFDTGAAPFIWLRPPHGDRNQDTFTDFASTLTLDVSIYARAAQSSADIDDAAARVRVVLHRASLPAPSGEHSPFATVSGPFGAPTSSPEIAGRRLSVALHVRG